MREPEEAPKVATFGGLRFESDSGDLEGPAGNARLAPQPSQLLAYLVARRGEVVARAEIGEHLWPGGNVEVDQGIAFAIREIRKGIEAVGGDPGAIETIPKRGYRLSVEVRGPTSGATPSSASRASRASPASQGSPASSASRASSAPPGFPQRGRLAIGAGVLLAIAAIVLFARPGATPVIVVFEHESAVEPVGAANGTPTADFIAQLATTLTADLAAHLTTTLTATFEDRLSVIGPTGAAILDGPNDTDVARSQLGACLVMSGSARLLASERQIESAGQ
ncbi:MAG: hypothetical protein HKN71_01235, partial [Gemmatimonadetes bacterium]|nr:hypothetical protein [Gemmatimonadota bacterium]